ncbi:rRNA maturation RNase YbeY [Brumimicrobium aurantiacum]|uniref:Endoribonuclease YbeY n=1 Tax=Brumimicrobium aurantiacum TaxID=1737063 RepID=A0A3E1F2D0_9FLAO|nr:rRNA maturation RNase YbeY [Brumimicrobium aurantiacum]RFC55867.1 rRNA maturation RNase YbeY [Brumimicrobium aurantiacum]
MINFQFVDVTPTELNHVQEWFEQVVENEGKILADLSIVIGSDEWLLEKNIEFLDHDYYTDIITFDYCVGDTVSGDLLISLDRIIDNANEFNVSRETELNRVLVHGLLHLCGYGDKSSKEIEIMRKKEDYYLSLL